MSTWAAEVAQKGSSSFSGIFPGNSMWAAMRCACICNACAGFSFIFVRADLAGGGGGKINIIGLCRWGPYNAGLGGFSGGCFGLFFVCECSLTFAL